MERLRIFLPLLLWGTVISCSSEKHLSPQQKDNIKRDSLIKVGTAFKVNSHKS